MKKSVKAALYSGLLFPGTGHFSLGRYPRGMLFFMPAFISFIFLVHNALSKAYAIVERIERNELPQDPQAIALLISADPGESELLLLRIVTWTLIACWLGSIIDAYRLGKTADNADANKP